jgi:hypothetical protein
LLLDRKESTDLFVEGDQVFAEFLEAVRLGHLLLRLAQRRGAVIEPGRRSRKPRNSSRSLDLWVSKAARSFGIGVLLSL